MLQCPGSDALREKARKANEKKVENWSQLLRSMTRAASYQQRGMEETRVCLMFGK